jgi:hypothetical protein
MQFASYAEERTRTLAFVEGQAGDIQLDPIAWNVVGEFPPLVDGFGTPDVGICMGENITDYRSLAHVYGPTDTITPSSATVVQSDSRYVSDASCTAFDRLQNMFMFSRGSRRFKAYMPTNTRTVRVTEQYGTVASKAQFELAPGGLANDVSFELPYYVPWVCQLVRSAASGFVAGQFIPGRSILFEDLALSNVASVSQFGVYQAAGDDFAVGVLVSPPSTHVSSGADYVLPPAIYGIYPF